MRIALVTTHPPGKGSLNEYAYHFVRFLRQKPEVSEVILLVDELTEGETYLFDETSDQAPLTVIPCWQFNAVNNALRIRKAVQQVDPDVVLFNIQFASFGEGKVSGALGLTAPALVKNAGYPTVVLLHNIMETVDLKSAGFGGNRVMETLIRFSGNIFTRFVLKADLVALTIPKYVETLEAKYGADNVLLAPHGSFDEVDEPTYDLPAGPYQIMAFGKFGTYKKVEDMIDAVQLLREKGYESLEIVIAGSDSPNAAGYLERVEQDYAEVPGLRFTGYVAEEDVPRIFSDAAVVVFPYTSTTGSSGVLHQAGNYGKAVALPLIGDLAEIVSEEGYVGEFFEPGNPESLAHAIAHLIDNPELRVDMGRRNYLAACGIPIAEVVDWYLLHFQTLLDAPRGDSLSHKLKPANSQN